ncbi:MAG TPA: LysR family transcriptional regulator, partial [Sandaracinaceae bacterium LLY-WYZ-13_1]|nr:LysR family transcriptional regulator [Sandaracinaceae bacterium LLY-WYZ-13_1]
MEHLRRLYRVWNWLPAFRAVAETEHLPTASEMLHVSPSALSRSIKQLEGELGQPLFRRIGRRLELSPAGEELLRALQESMSRLDRGLSAASTSQFIGPVRVSAQEPFATAFVLRALDALIEAHPLVVPHLAALAPPTACRWV